MKNLSSSFASLWQWPTKAHYLGLWLILALPLFGVAQDPSLHTGLLRQTWYSKDKKVTYTQRMEAGLDLLYWYTTSTRQDSLHIIAQEMLVDAKKHKDPEWTAEALYWIARYHLHRGEIQGCIRATHEALLQPGLKESKYICWYYANLGNAYSNLDQLDSAEYYYKRALAGGQKHGQNIEEIGNLYENLAYVYELQGKYLDAIDVYTKMLNATSLKQQFYANLAIGELFKTLGLHVEVKVNFEQANVIAKKTTNIVIRLNNYSAQLAVSKNLVEAERFIQKGLALRDSFDSNYEVLTLFLSAGDLYLDSLQLDRATDFYQRALALATKIKDIGLKNDALLALAKIHQLQGRTQQSIQICQDIKAPLEKNRSSRSLATLYEILSKNYEALQQPVQALFYLRQKEAQEAILNDEENIKAALNTYIRRKSEGERRALKLAKTNAEKLALATQAKAQLNYSILGLISLGLVGAVGAYYYFYRQKKSTAEHLAVLNESLELEKLKLTKTNSKLRRFSGIVSHDILSNLDLILSAGNVLVGTRPNAENLNKYYALTQNTGRQLKDYCIGLLAEANAGADPAVAEIGDPNTVLSRVMERFGPALQAKGFVVEKGELISNRLPLSVVEQVLQNLVSNTLRYMGQTSNPLLQIGSGIDATGHSYWYVTDNGPGQAEVINRAIAGQVIHSSKGQGKGLYLLQNTLQDYGWDLKAETVQGRGIRMVMRSIGI